MADEAVISVEIHGQRYPIRSGLDQEYVARLASYVDEKMRAAADSTPTGDSLRLAVLTALNIADELFRCRDGTRPQTASWPNAPASSNGCSIASSWHRRGRGLDARTLP